MRDLTELPNDLPVPEDDGACDHLPGRVLPSLELDSTSGAPVNPADLFGRSVVYGYPMIGHPDAPPMDGWNEIPGARGCTPESCSFRDAHDDLRDLGVRVFGLSAQPLAEQKEAVERLHLPFALLNDSGFRFTRALKLPTFSFRGDTYIRRLTLAIRDGIIESVFYPVFPPDRHVDDVLQWLQNRCNTRP